MAIIFSAEEHTYKNKETGKQYTSVSKVLESFKNKFDKDYWSTYKAYEKVLGKKFKTLKKGFPPYSNDLMFHLAQYVDEKELIKARNEILAEWTTANKNSITRGNMYHKNQEKKSYIDGFQKNPFNNESYPVYIPENLEIDSEKITSTDVYKIDQFIDSEKKETGVQNLYELEDGFYPELLLWNDKYMIAGQADKVFIKTDKDTGIRYIDIDDYKTNKKIKTENKHQYMKSPLEYLSDCNYNHYRLQISTYAWMLEQFGFEVNNTAFTHFNKMYQFQYMRGEVKKMLKVFKEKQGNG